MQQILVTTYQEMNKYGMKFTMDDVAAQLGMSKKTLYKLFRSKNELVLAVIESLIQFVKAKEQIVLKSDAFPCPKSFLIFYCWILMNLDTLLPSLPETSVSSTRKLLKFSKTLLPIGPNC